MSKKNDFICHESKLKESGLLLEKIIINNNDKIETILYDKEIDNSDLLNIELWNKNNFEELHKICLDKFEKFYGDNKKNIKNFILKKDEEQYISERQKNIIEYNKLRWKSKFSYKFNFA